MGIERPRGFSLGFAVSSFELFELKGAPSLEAF
jgi:hypothetical protein